MSVADRLRSTGGASTSTGRSLALLAGVNVAVLLALLLPVELVFGTWIRPMGLHDLKRFSIPVNVRYDFDTTNLYSSQGPSLIHYSRDAWGLRGRHRTPKDIQILTVGGSTTDQRFLDDDATWQAAAQRRLTTLGTPFVISNAGVDGQSTVGHLFNFDFWFPVLPDLRPALVLFYVGINDVLRHDQRVAFDSSVDASSWRMRSATYQLLRTVRNNFRARAVGVYHGRRRELKEASFTAEGLLRGTERRNIADRVTMDFLENVEQLRHRVDALGAKPVFMTQTALAWSGDPEAEPFGLKDTISIHGVTVNYADVSFIHQELNRRLVQYCNRTNLTCFDLARELRLEAADYYDYLHNTPAGAEAIGAYVADRIRALHITSHSAR